MPTENQPYEFLARWRDGKLSGSHVQSIEVTTVDGVKVAEKVGNALPVGAEDFPLQDILDQISADALTALAEANATIKDLQSKLDALQAKHDDVVSTVASGDEAAIAAKVAEVQQTEKQKESAELAKQIAELQAKLAEVNKP